MGNRIRLPAQRAATRRMVTRLLRSILGPEPVAEDRFDQVLALGIQSYASESGLSDTSQRLDTNAISIRPSELLTQDPLVVPSHPFF
eukprot:8730929-Pyramimonas_sp.AAC.1